LTEQIPTFELNEACTAHHEAGHMVVAAVNGLRLRPDGLSVDSRREGLCCYHKEPDGSPLSRERIIVSKFAGYYAEWRYRNEFGLLEKALSPELYFVFSSDGKEARKLSIELSKGTWSNKELPRSAPDIENDLQQQSEKLIGQHWNVIRTIADALLAKEWENMKPLVTGTIWSNAAKAKYLSREEAVSILECFSINAVCCSCPDCFD
jgi:hypothetical protein